MRYEEFQRHVGKAGLSLTEFAKLIRMNRVSLSNLSRREEVPSHLAVIASLLGEMAEHGLDFRATLERLEISPKKARGGASPRRFGGTKQNDLFAASPPTDDHAPLPPQLEHNRNIRMQGDGLEGAR